MSDVIHFPGRTAGNDNLIIARPMCFRRADWAGVKPLQVERAMAEIYQAARLDGTHPPGSHVPPGVTLRGSLERTLTGLYRMRNDAGAMAEIYYLAGLMELACGLAHRVMRTDLIRRVFGTISEISDRTGVKWPASNEGFLLPLGPLVSPGEGLEEAVGRAGTLKELLIEVRLETDRQFEMICRDFIFYLPST